MKLLSAEILLIFLFGTISSQEKSKDSLKPKVKIDFPSCEENNSQLGILSQYTNRDELIIVVSHLNKSEKKDYGQRRLYNAETFLVKGATKFNHSPERILIAHGNTTEGLGHLDFYVKGELELRVFFKKNTDLRLPPCVYQFPDEKLCETNFEK